MENARLGSLPAYAASSVSYFPRSQEKSDMMAASSRGMLAAAVSTVSTSGSNVTLYFNVCVNSLWGNGPMIVIVGYTPSVN